jgi:broad specificity phosphatase PhoE
MILLRHGQSAFNAAFTATRRDPGIPDPGLTEQGRAQAESAAAALIREEVSHIVASPYTRALQTAAPLARRLGLPVLINPVVRERYAFSCDVGSTRTALAHAWPDLDFAHLDEVWWPAIAEPADAVRGRANLFRAEMAALPHWSRTVVVSHWGFILSLTGVSLANGEWLRCDPTAAAELDLAGGL